MICRVPTGLLRGVGLRERCLTGATLVIYLLMIEPGIIYLFYVYTKGEMTDLKPEQKKRLRQAVEEIKAQYKK